MVEIHGVAVFAPVPLVTVTLERSATGEEQMHVHLGGQGVWVARLVERFGLPVALCTVFGGETGEVARTLIGSDAIDVRSTNTLGWNGGYVHDRREGERRQLAEVAPGPLLRHELDALYSDTLAASFDLGVCVLTGTHTYPVIAPATYRRLAHDLHRNGVKVVADLSAEYLAEGLAGGLTVLKVSEEELRRDGWITGHGSDVVEEALVDLVQRGAEHVVISRGAEPAEALFDGRRFRVATPVMEAIDHRGAGDAMTGMLAAGLATGLEAPVLLAFAAAAGAATVVRHGYATGTKEAITSMSKAVEVTELT